MRHSLQAVLAAAAACAALSACGVTRAHNAGPNSSRAFPVGNFSSIEVAGPYDVQVTSGGKAGVSVKGPQNILDSMVVEVVGNELRIHSKKDGGFRTIHWGKHSPVTVAVTAPAIEAATIAGSGDIALDRAQGAAFKGAVAGSGSLSVGAVDVRALTLEIAGSGDIKASGKADQAAYKIAGSGEIEGGGVAVQALSVSIAGSGDVAAQAAGTADVKIMGSGDVTVTGGAKCTVSKMGSGSANCS